MKFNLRVAFGVGVASLGMVLVAAPSSMAAGGGCSNANADLGSLSRDQTRAAVICLFNNARSGGALANNGDLQTAAQRHTNTMRKKDCFKHTCPGEDRLAKRVKRTGYYSGDAELGEVIAFAADNSSPDDVVDKWLDSSRNRGLITRSSFQDVGVGVNVSDGNVLLTGVLGRP